MFAQREQCPRRPEVRGWETGQEGGLGVSFPRLEPRRRQALSPQGLHVTNSDIERVPPGDSLAWQNPRPAPAPPLTVFGSVKETSVWDHQAPGESATCPVGFRPLPPP